MLAGTNHYFAAEKQSATPDPPTPDDDATEGVPSYLVHLYRGELGRVTAWRDRLDRTTTWTVTLIASLLTWVFSIPDNPHYLLLIGIAAVAVFHFVETRRYRVFDV